MERLDSLLLDTKFASKFSSQVSSPPLTDRKIRDRQSFINQKTTSQQTIRNQVAVKNTSSLESSNINSSSENTSKNSLSNNWLDTLEAIKSSVESKLYFAWFHSLEFKDANLADEKLTLKISAPNKFTKDHIIREHKALLINSVKKAYSCNKVEISFQVSTTSSIKKNKIVLKNNSQRNLSPNSQLKLNSKPNLNPNYSFSNFIVGDCNKIAHDSCSQASSHLGKLFNPLFIYGDSGLGKTHLANAVGNECIKQNKKVLFVSSERFVSELVSSIRNKKMDSFKAKFRNLDLLIIDDIQFIIGKQRTQEEFFHTFNELFEKQKQIIITSDKAPQHFDNLEPRLRSRFSSGLSIDLKSPDSETIKKVILNKSAKLALNLSEESISLISKRVNDNFRELEGAINRISAISKSPSNTQIQDVLNNLYPRKYKRIDAELIMELVSNKFNILVKDLTGKRRTKNIAAARHIAMFLCREITGHSYPEIGRLFGGRDHSTAIHAYKCVDKKAREDQNYSLELESIRNSLRQ